jgi:apolipoprotein N-acyltransferase
MGALGSVATGAMLAALYPNVGASGLAWVALVPLILAARASSPRGAACQGFAAGTLFFLILIEWIRLFDTTGWIVASLILAAYVALFALLVRLLAPAPAGWGALLVPASAWTALEWMRGLGPFGFTWGGLAYSQHGNLPLLQLASVTGPYGITFLIAAVNAGVAAVIGAAWPGKPLAGREGALRGVGDLRGALARLGVVMVAVGICAAWGYHRLHRGAGATPKVRVAVLQGALGWEGDRSPRGTDAVWESTEVYLRLTEEAARQGAQIVIWPESSMPGRVELDPEFRPVREALVAAAARLQVSLLVGGSHLDEAGRLLNSTFLYTPDSGLAGRYDKVHLVPYGEFTPWRQSLDFLYRHFPVIDHEFHPGKGHFPLRAREAPLGVAICFESAFPGIARAVRRAGARLLVVMTNDAWFGERSATWQHYHMAAFRAVECGAAVARASTSGISALIDPYGRAVTETRLFERTLRVGDLPLAQGPTPYLLAGDVVAWFSALAILLLLGARWRQTRRIAAGL